MNTKATTNKIKTDKSNSLQKRNMSNKMATTKTKNNMISEAFNPMEDDTQTPMRIKYDPSDYKTFIMNKYTESTITGERERNFKRISPIIQDAIDAYNDWVQFRLPKQLKQPIRMGDNQIFEFTDVKIHKPMNEQGSTNQLLYPNMARIAQKSYFSTIDAKYKIYSVDKNRKKKTIQTSDFQRIGTIPTMLGSVLCHLSNMSSEELIQQSECVYDLFGYFIINGTERAVGHMERLRVNRMFVYETKVDNDVVPTCRMTSNNINGTTFTQYNISKSSGVINITFGSQGDTVKCNPFILMSLFGITPSEIRENINEFVSATESTNEQKLQMYIDTTLYDYEDHFDDELKTLEIDENSGKEGKKKRSEIREIAFNVIKKSNKDLKSMNKASKLVVQSDKYLFSQVNDLYDADRLGYKDVQSANESKQNRYTTKMNMTLMYLIFYIKYLCGDKTIDNRNSYDTKRLVNSAGAIEAQFIAMLSNMRDEIAEKTASSLSITSIMSEQRMHANFYKALVNNTWTSKGTSLDTNVISNIIQNTTLLLKLSLLVQIKIPVYRKGKQFLVRMVENTQNRFVDIADSPEGENCGLNKSKAITCYVSRDYDLQTVVHMVDNDKHVLDFPDKTHRTPLLLNGIMLGWCNWTYYYTKLIMRRRQGKIGSDCSIMYRDGLLQVHCDYGRPTRPVFVVENQKFMFDEVRKMFNVYERKIDEMDKLQDEQYDIEMDKLYESVKGKYRERLVLSFVIDGIGFNDLKYLDFIKLGVVEYVDASELEQDHILLAIDLETFNNGINEVAKLDKIVAEKSEELAKYKTTLEVLAKRFNSVKDQLKSLKNEGDVGENDRANEPEDGALKDETQDDENTSTRGRGKNTKEDSAGKSSTIVSRDNIDTQHNASKDLATRKSELVQKGKNINKQYELINGKIRSVKQEIERYNTLLEKERNKNNFDYIEFPSEGLFSIPGSIIPLPEHNQAPRNTYQCGMGKQAIGYFNSAYKGRFDNNSIVLSHPTPSLFNTQMSDYYGLNEIPAGETIKLAFMTYGGWAQEDAIIVNKASIDRGRFRAVRYYVYDLNTGSTSNEDSEIIRNPLNSKNVAGIPDHVKRKFRAIDKEGVPIKGSHVKDGDVIIGKVRTKTTSDMSAYGIKSAQTDEDASIVIRKGEHGVVDEVYTSRINNQIVNVRVKIRQVHKPEIGDKFATRYAQKSTIGMILPEVDMPRTREGVAPDIIVNPHCLPSRMTIAKLYELVASKLATMTGEKVNATSHSGFNLQEIEDGLHRYGFSKSGKEKLYNGMTGEWIEVPIFIGPCYYQVLSHLVDKKIQARGSSGATDHLTNAPAQGRKRGGGLRVGEMERDALISHGQSYGLEYTHCKGSDAFHSLYCNNCGEFALLKNPNYEISKVMCTRCGNEEDLVTDPDSSHNNFVKGTVPYSMVRLNAYIKAMGISAYYKLDKVENVKKVHINKDNDDDNELSDSDNEDGYISNETESDYSDGE